MAMAYEEPIEEEEKIASTTSTTSTTTPPPPAASVTVNANVKKSRNIVAGLKAFAERVNAAGVDGLRATFAKLQQRGPHPAKMSAIIQAHNKAKCRYFDVPCLDETRVILKPWPNAQGDFIHANWVSHELIENKFVCTQAPLDSTIGDFWRMVWQENIDLILMLCRVTEGGKTKCAQYWPNTVGGTKTFYGITIKNETIRNKDPDIWGTDLLVSYGGEQRKITHYQWITWPDRFVPQQLVVPFILLSLARTRKQPTLIHCSAGIGRTGTLVALEIFIRALLQGSDLSISDIIWSIRSQRSKSVQTEEQFLYMHYIVIQRLVNKGILSDRIASNFCRSYEHYYFAKTHMVQVPLPVYIRKRSPSQPKRRAVEKASLISATDEANKSLERRAKCLAINEETLAALRMSFTRRCLLRKSKKIQPTEKVEAKEVPKTTTPDSAEVDKTIKHAMEVVRQFQASKSLPDPVQQQYEQALRALQALQLTTDGVKSGAQLKTPTTLPASAQGSKIVVGPSSSTISVTTSTTHTLPPSQPTSADGKPSPGLVAAPSSVHAAVPSKPAVSSAVAPLPTVAVAATSATPTSVGVENVKTTSEKKRQESVGTASVDGPMKESDDDEDFSAEYYFMQPEWASLYPAERKKNSEAIEEHYASEGLDKNMEGSTK